ncbi:gas vesicle protein GvpN [Oscillatoriales cyanobacterium USR001]|nr:gas vesicle protein GvpN [Oscillatoriales cyanobacterium USR001]
MTTVLRARPKGFVNTRAAEEMALRALRYLKSGFGVHLRGPAGTGKTTLALHLADLLARPTVLMFGDDQLKSSDLIGNQSGYTRKKVVDNYIHSVIKLEDELRQNWVDSRLTLACREGFTLVYDEFNRSRPEVNNVLLSALEEKLLVLPPNGNKSEYIKVHPQFRAIFTSNSEEYCGVHDTQDALMDRLVTMNMPEPDAETQQEIIVGKLGIDREYARRIVELAREFRYRLGTEKASGMRPALIIAKICQEHAIAATGENIDFREICEDVLLSRSGKPLLEAAIILKQLYQEMSVNWPVLETAESAKLLGENYRSDVLKIEQNSDTIEKVTPISQTPTLTSELMTRAQAICEEEVYTYLQQSRGAKVAEIETALGINRVQTIDALRSLIKKGVLKQEQNRLFVTQGDR